MRSNCLFFAIALFSWRYVRWRKDPSRPVPYITFRPSFVRGGPFHALVGTLGGDGRLGLISYKPCCDEKPYLGRALGFKGRVVRGD